MTSAHRSHVRIASFNVLGASHTAPGGNKASRPSGVERMKLTAELVEKHKLDVVGFQEFEPEQRRAFMKDTHHQFAMFPDNKVGKGDGVNSVAWRKDKFDLVKAKTIKIPYFGGHTKNMPVVLLRDKKTGQRMWVTNFHNPASTKFHPGNEHWRDVATQKEVELVNRLEKKTGLPVFITGDMNEKEEYRQHIRKGTDMHAAMSGKNSHSHRVGIDWIFGSPDVQFSGYTNDHSGKVRRASDHPMVFADAYIPAGHKK